MLTAALCATFFILKYAKANPDYSSPSVPDPAVCSEFCLQKSYTAYPSWTNRSDDTRSTAGQTDWKRSSMEPCVHSHVPYIQIYTEKQAYRTGEDITFQAVTEEPEPLEFLWYFGDQTATTSSSTFVRRYLHPGRYVVSVSVFSSRGSLSSDIYPVLVQKAVQINRLLYSRSVLLNSSVRFSCRINAGTDVSYLWDFGDGTQRAGPVAEDHIYNRTGEFVIKVTAYNLVSSATLGGHMFVVSEPCQPPPVKNMGPSKVQVWRYQRVFVGVTYESELQCNVSRGLHYSWTIYDTHGLELPIKHLDTNQQRLKVPEFLLHYGTYRAVAKVQVLGSIVYSNYSVLIEVIPSAPVSIISGGTNVFINRRNGETKISLDARRSYDPDYPGSIMSYRWSCRPLNVAQSSCFTQNIPASSSVLTFPVSALKSSCDLFRFTLTVHTGDRSSSSEAFITLRSKPTRIVHVSCEQCRGNSVNWDEPFSVRARCESCPKNITYSWKLYVVNASSKSVPEVPFCGSLDPSLPSNLEEDTLFLASTSPSITDKKETSNSNERDPEMKNKHHGVDIRGRQKHRVDLFETDGASGAGSELEFPLYPHPVQTKVEISSRMNSTPEDSIMFGRLDGMGSGTGGELDFSSFHHPVHDYDEIYSGIEEADPGLPIGRPTGPHSVDDVIPFLSEFEGDNLVGLGSMGHVTYEKTLLDLHRELVDPALFDSYTARGTTWSVVTFKPRMLKPNRLYMLEVSAGSDQGKAQLFFSTRPAPDGTSCHVQPSTGQEILTHFSIFCTSGKEDLFYEYSFKVGNSTKRRLYRGTDYQHYFNLPSGDAHDHYKVTIYIQIWNKFGASTNPCAVNVTVWPSFMRNSSAHTDPDQELFVYGLNNLTNLIQTRNTQDILNYISLLTAALNRLCLDSGPVVELQTITRAALINAVCLLNVTDRDSLLNVLHVLTDLLKVSNQVPFDSAKLVVKYIRDRASRELNTSDVGLLEALVFVLSYLLETRIPSSRSGIQLTQDVLHITTDSVQTYMLLGRTPHCSLNITSIRVEAWQHHSFPATTKTVDVATFYIPHILQRTGAEERSCFITQLISYRVNPYHWGRAPAQLNGSVADMRVFNCSSRREIRMRYLSSPIIIEFQKEEEENRDGARFTLSGSDVKTHQFSVTAELLTKAVQIRLEFSRPATRPFPILLLFRLNQRPTPALYNVRTIYKWKGEAAQIFLPPSSLKDVGTGYLMLLSTDYDKALRHKYVARSVNYTLSIESWQCLVWDGARDWWSDGCLTLPSSSSSRINCCCSQLSSFAVSHQKLSSTSSVSSTALYTSVRTSLVVCTMLLAVSGLYAVLLLICKRADVQTEKNLGLFLLPDNNPSDRFLYAVTVDTGLRSRARMTAKLYIVLHGEDGVSQTRELSDPDHTLFTCNSRHTFILSSEQSLGRIRQVCLWHDDAGLSPSWFLNHVTVQDLREGSRWTFLARCWLAPDEGDGRVERKLLALERRLTFRQLLRLNLSDCLEDFHPWLSVYSRPSYSAHTHTQRLSVCVLLLYLYMCANSVLVYLQDDQCWGEAGLIGVSVISVRTGLCALVLLPLGSLVSFLFRISKANKNRSHSGDQYKVRLPNIVSVEDHPFCDTFLPKRGVTEPNLSRSPASAWRKKCEVLEVCDSDHKLQKNTQSSSHIKEIEENIAECKEKKRSRSFKQIESDLQPSSFTAILNQSSYRTQTLQTWCHYITWALWLCLSLACLIITAALGLKFSSTKVLLWMQSVYFSLIFCVFAAQPVMVLIIAVFVTLCHRDRVYFDQTSPADEPVVELLKNNAHTGLWVGKGRCSVHHTEESDVGFEKVLATRQRARYLRLARPPTSTQLKAVRNRFKKRKLLHKTIRELLLHIFSLSVVVFVAYGKSSNDQFHLSEKLRPQFTGSRSVQDTGVWWNWAANTLLDEVYLYHHMEHDVKNIQGTFLLIGDPVMTKMEDKPNSSCQIFVLGLLNVTSCSSALVPGAFRASSKSQRCGKLRCYEASGIGVHLGRNRSEASSKMKKLWTSGWMNRSTRAVMVQFTLYSPVYNLFSTLTVLGETLSAGHVLPSVDIQSTRIQPSSSVCNYFVTAAELVLLLLALLQLYFQIHTVIQRGSFSWRDLQNWMEVITEMLSVLCFVCSVHRFTLSTDVMEDLLREGFKMFVDLSSLSSWEQLVRSLYGLLMFLLLMKCISLLCRTDVMSTAASTALIFSNLFWPLISGAILIVALCSVENLLFNSDLFGFCTVSSVISLRFGVKQRIEPDHRNRPSVTLCCYVALFCTLAYTVKAMVTGAVMSAVKTATKRKSRKIHLSVSEIGAYVRDGILALAGRGRTKRRMTDNHNNSNNFVLEEFEGLVDELLVRLSVISSSDDPGEEQDFEDQSLLRSVYDYNPEVTEENRIYQSVCESLYPHKEIRLRSLLERKTLGTIHDLPLLHSDDQDVPQNVSASLVQKINQTPMPHYRHQTFSVKARETQSSNHFTITRDDLKRNDNTVQNTTHVALNTPTDNITTHTHRDVYRTFYESLVENIEKCSEVEMGKIPGQCCHAL